MEKKMEDRKVSGALENAECKLASILELHAACGLLLDGEVKKAEACGVVFKDADEVVEFAVEMALSVEVRSDWRVVGEKLEAVEYRILLAFGEKLDAVEYRILLAFGGPACQVVGFVDEGRPRIQYQDWGTPLTDLIVVDDKAREALVWFVGCFYLGD